MTAPDTIFADMQSRHQGKGLWETVPFEGSPDSPQYTRTDLIPAMIADAVACEYARGVLDAAMTANKVAQETQWDDLRFGARFIENRIKGLLPLQPTEGKT